MVLVLLVVVVLGIDTGMLLGIVMFLYYGGVGDGASRFILVKKNGSTSAQMVVIIIGVHRIFRIYYI